MTLNKNFITNLKDTYRQQQSERSKIIAAGNLILHDSKRVIFAIHRGDLQLATDSLKDIEGRLTGLFKKYSYQRLNQEGAYNAGVEEYVEAKTFYLVTSGQKIKKITGIRLSVEAWLGGLCDLTGELVRQAINQAAAGNYEQARVNKEIIEEILSQLVEFDITGYLRTKYDQARNSLKKIEQINYELNLKK